MPDVNNIDIYGVLGTRVYSSLDAAHAPSVAGQIMAVDDGTNGAFYMALHVAGTLSWLPVPVPFVDVYQIRPDPTDSRKMQYSADSGATWHNLSFISADTVTTNPQSSGEVLVTGGTDFAALNLYNPNNFYALIAQAQGAPSIFIDPVDGEGDSPAIRISVPDGKTYNNLIETVIGGEIQSQVNREGAIVAKSVTALPVANAARLGSIVYLESDGTVQGAFYVCVQNADLTTYAWIQILDWSTPPPPLPSDLTYPPLPPPGAPAVTFAFWVSGEGAPLPWKVPIHYTCHVEPGYGQSSHTIGDHSWVADKDGVPGYEIALTETLSVQLGEIYWQGQPVTSTGEYTGTPEFSPYTTDLVTSADEMVFLVVAADVTETDIPFDSFVMIVTIIPPSADWTVEYASVDGSPPTSGFYGDTITISSTVGGGGFVGPEMLFNAQVKLTVVSTSGYVEGPSTGNTMYGYDPANKFGTDPHTWAHVFEPPSAPDPVGSVWDSVLTALFLSYTGGTTYTIQLKIDEP